MPRASKGFATRRSRNRIRKRAKGFRGGRRLYRVAKQTVKRALQYSYDHRRAKKRDFRRLWIVRISAACRARDIAYNRFIAGLTKSNVTLNRQQLSQMAINDPAGFDRLVALAKESLQGA